MNDEPKTKEEYEQRYKDNTRYEGFGLETTIVFPCPFCAASDWATVKLFDFELAKKGNPVALTLAKEHVCKECLRGAQMDSVQISRGVDPTPTITSATFWMVQTCGSNPPGWVPIKRRKD